MIFLKVKFLTIQNMNIIVILAKRMLMKTASTANSVKDV